MSTFTLAISCLTTSNFPWFMDLTFQFPMQYCSYSIGPCFYHQSHPQLGVVFALAPTLHSFLELFLQWSPVAYWAPTNLVSSSFSVLSFCLFILFMGFSEKAMATHSSPLSWKIPWTEEPGGLPCMGSHRVGNNWHDLAAAALAWGSQGKNTEVVCHSLLQWTAFCQTSPPWPVHFGWPHTAWLSFIELDKAVVHVIRLACCLWLWFQSLCSLMSSLCVYRLTWVSRTLNVEYLFTAAPAKCNRCSLPWMWDISSQPLLLTLDVGECLLATASDLGRGVAPLGCSCTAQALLLCGIEGSANRGFYCCYLQCTKSTKCDGHDAIVLRSKFWRLYVEELKHGFRW